MKQSAILILLFGLVLMAFADPLPPPLAPANDGKLLCVEPEPETKTCNELIRYSEGDGGMVQAHTIGALDDDSRVIWEGSAPMEIMGGRICDRSRPEDLKHHQVRIQPGTKGLPNAETYKAYLYATVTAMQHHARRAGDLGLG